MLWSFISDTILLQLDNVRHRSEIYNMLCLYTVIEFSAFTYVILKIIENKIFKIIIIASGIAFYILAVSLYLVEMRDTNKSFDSLSASLEAILIVVYSILYLFDQMNKPQVIFIYQEPNFWFVVGFIIYFSGSLFLFIQASNLDREIRDNYWNITYFLNITKNILFAIAFSTNKSRTLVYNSDNPFDNDILENPYKT